MGFIAGLDLGQSMDYSALVIVDRQQPARDERVRGSTPPLARYAVRHLKRWDLGTPYPQIVREVTDLLTHPPLVADHKLLVDYTGCGRPVVDMLKQACLRPVAVSIHGGDRVSQDGMDYRVPKRDLVGVVAVLLQQARLQIAQSLPETPMLTHELLNFKVKIDPSTSHDSYSVWREQDHNYLVLALALAVWWGEFRGERRAGVWPLLW
jgi:hypothetical protein